MSVEKNTETPPEPSPASLASWLRSWRYFIALLGLSFLVALFYAEENWRGKRDWQRYRDQMAARGKPMAPSAFIPKPVPMSENFAMTPLLAPLFEFRPGTQKWRITNAIQLASGFAPLYDSAANMVTSPKTERSNSWMVAKTDLALWHAAFLLGTNSRSSGQILEPDAVERFPVKESAAEVLKALSECDPVLEEIRTASQRKYSRFEIKYDEEDPAGILLPHLAVLKHFTQVLQLRASAELALGGTVEAANDITLIFYLIDSIREEPIMISQMIRMAQLRFAIQPLAEGLGQWSEPQLLSFEERLRQLDFCADMKRALDAEKVFFGGGVIDYLRRNPAMYSALAGGGSGVNFPGGVFGSAPSGWFDFEKVNYCRVFDAYSMPGLDLPNHRISPRAAQQADQQVINFTGRSWPVLLFRHRVFSALLMPGFANALRKTAFAQTCADSAAIACALERYRRAHGVFPASLDDLTANGKWPSTLGHKLPSDVINGQPLHYRLTEDGRYVLYSVGWNEKDDGGTIVSKKDEFRLVKRAHEVFGEGDATTGGDWVWRPL
jgi:hypothetical protein